MKEHIGNRRLIEFDVPSTRSTVKAWEEKGPSELTDHLVAKNTPDLFTDALNQVATHIYVEVEEKLDSIQMFLEAGLFTELYLINPQKDTIGELNERDIKKFFEIISEVDNDTRAELLDFLSPNFNEAMRHISCTIPQDKREPFLGGYLTTHSLYMARMANNGLIPNLHSLSSNP